MKSKNTLLVIAVLMSNGAFMQAMVSSTRARQMASRKIFLGNPAKPSDISTVNIPVNRPLESKSPFGPKGQVRSYSQQRSRVEYDDLDHPSDWKAFASPFQRSFMSYVPFTQAYSMYQKKYYDLAQFRHLLDKWENIVCQKYVLHPEKDQAIKVLRTDMESFYLNTISVYKKEIYVYSAALFNSCLAWYEMNPNVYTPQFLDLLYKYVEIAQQDYANSLGKDGFNVDNDHLMSEYPFFKAFGIRVDNYKKMKKEYRQQEARSEENLFKSVNPAWERFEEEQETKSGNRE